MFGFRLLHRMKDDDDALEYFPRRIPSSWLLREPPPEWPEGLSLNRRRRFRPTRVGKAVLFLPDLLATGVWS
jgi:hypothetical protein